jgi:phytol kinase
MPADIIFYRLVFPSARCWLIAFPASLVACSAFGWLSGYLKSRYKLKTGYSRKIFHFIIFTAACIAGITGGLEAVEVLGTAVGIIILYAVIRGKKSILFNALARSGDKPYEKFYIIIPFLMTAAGGMATSIFFGRYAVIGFITAGWGDAAGEPAGTLWGKRRYRIPTFTGIRCYRTIEGSIAVFIVSFTGCVILSIAGFDLSVPVLLCASFVTALTTTLVEAISFHSIDNLAVQIISTFSYVISINLLSGIRLSGS